MRRVEADEKWSLMCPDECPGLYETWGEEFDKLYEKLVTVCTCTFSEVYSLVLWYARNVTVCIVPQVVFEVALYK